MCNLVANTQTDFHSSKHHYFSVGLLVWWIFAKHEQVQDIFPTCRSSDDEMANHQGGGGTAVARAPRTGPRYSKAALKSYRVIRPPVMWVNVWLSSVWKYVESLFLERILFSKFLSVSLTFLPFLSVCPRKGISCDKSLNPFIKWARPHSTQVKFISNKNPIQAFSLFLLVPLFLLVLTPLLRLELATCELNTALPVYQKDVALWCSDTIFWCWQINGNYTRVSSPLIQCPDTKISKMSTVCREHLFCY